MPDAGIRDGQASFFLIFAGEPEGSSHLMAELHPHKYDDGAYKAALERIRARWAAPGR